MRFLSVIGCVLFLLFLLVIDATATDRPWNPDGTISVKEEQKDNPNLGDKTTFFTRWNLIGSLSIKEEYNDNLYFGDDEEGDKVDDFLTTISPGLELSRTTDRVQLRLIGTLDRRIYMSESDLDATDQSYLASVRYVVTPKFSLAGQAGFTKDSSPDRDLETSGLVQGTSKREQWHLGLSTEHQITESMSATLSYAYSKDRDKSEDDNDSESNGVTLLLASNLEYFIQESKGRLTLGYNRNRYSDSKDDSYKMMLGFSKTLSETWRFVADAGVRYTRTREDAALYASDENSNDWGFVGQTELSWQGEKTDVTFSLSRDLLPASGRDASTDRTSLGISMTRQFTAECSGFLSGGYYRNRSVEEDTADDEVDEDTLYGSAGLRYAFTPDLGIEASYNYSMIEYNTRDTDADRNLFMVRVYAQHAFLD